MPTLEKVIVHVYPMSTEHKPYVIEFEHAAPCATGAKLASDIVHLLRSEYIAEGADNIKFKG